MIFSPGPGDFPAKSREGFRPPEPVQELKRYVFHNFGFVLGQPRQQEKKGHKRALRFARHLLVMFFLLSLQ